MQTIAGLDGGWTTSFEVSRTCKVTNLAAQQCLEQLMARGLLIDVLNTSTGHQYRFSSLGRDLAISRGWDLA